MKYSGKTMLTWLMTLAMLLSLVSGLMVPAWAADGEVKAPELFMWTSTDIVVVGVKGQEYVISHKGTEPDWSKAVEPDEEDSVSFEDLIPADAYTISTRIKGETGEVKTTDITMPLTGLGVYSADDYVVGAVFTVEPDPEDTKGLTYQWYHDAITTDEDGAQQHSLTPIEGATATTYTIQEADLGKYLAVKIFRDGEEVGDAMELGPVTDGSEAPADEPCPKDETCPISQFTDAKPDAWYHDGVHWALENGVMNGVSSTKFAPNAATTRGMVVTMLWRMEGEPDADSAGFKDVVAGSWYETAVNWAAANKIVSGYSSAKFGPNDSVTREQLVAILYRYAQYKEMDVSVGEDTNILSYDDAFSISEWAVPAMQWAVGAGIITGKTESTLAPKAKATRAEVATMLQRFCTEPVIPEDQEDDLYLILVNKTHKTPDDWEDKIELLSMKNAYDDDIRVEKGSYEAFKALREDLLKDGVDIELDSCYRSVERQKELWAEFEKEYGLEYTQKYVAVPGFSEHHTGFAVDVCLIKDGKLICENDDMMKETAIWEKVHEKMPEYGFILRYPADKVDITGYPYEPWHMRYVGDPAIAKEIAEKGITLEEYLDQVEPADAVVDFGTSDFYNRDEMVSAIALIRDELGKWGCELQIVRYAGDACSSADNVKRMNELKEGRNYTECIEFLTTFHTPEKDSGSLDPNKEYVDYQWWLARTEDGDWELVSWGY